MVDPLVEVAGVSKRYRRGVEEVHALREVGFALYPGELVALVGPSGSGKSSLLGVLCGWDLPDQGKLAWWSGFGSARENVALPVRLASRSGRRAPPRAGSARALVLGPRLLLADEPSAHHDSVWVHDVFSQLRAVAQAGAACLVATHDPDALAFADRILALEDGRLTEVAA